MGALNKIFLAIIFSAFNIYAAKEFINKKKIKATIFFVIGVCFLSFQAYMTFCFYNSAIDTNRSYNTIINTTIRRFEDKLTEKTISNNEREKLSVYLAKYKYEKRGIVSQIFEKDGSKKIFVPSEQNIENLKKEHEIQHAFRLAKKSLKNAILLWLGCLMLSLLIAATTLMKNAHNNKMKADD